MAILLGYAGAYKGLTFLGLALSAVAMILGMAPYICIWLVARDLIAVAPNWTQASGIASYGWMAFAFAITGIVVYFCALMCTHLAAFRTASNIRKQGMSHLMKAPLGFFDSNASGLLRNRLDGAASDTETLLAHNLADIVGTVAMFITMLRFQYQKGNALDCGRESCRDVRYGHPLSSDDAVFGHTDKWRSAARSRTLYPLCRSICCAFTYYTHPAV